MKFFKGLFKFLGVVCRKYNAVVETVASGVKFLITPLIAVALILTSFRVIELENRIKDLEKNVLITEARLADEKLESRLVNYKQVSELRRETDVLITKVHGLENAIYEEPQEQAYAINR